jgi:hypothetical protein
VFAKQSKRGVGSIPESYVLSTLGIGGILFYTEGKKSTHPKENGEEKNDEFIIVTVGSEFAGLMDIM